jgi:hypothetical protein
MQKKVTNHHKEDLAKCGYKPDMKYKSLIIFFFFFFLPHTKRKISKYQNIKKLTILFSHF